MISVEERTFSMEAAGCNAVVVFGGADDFDIGAGLTCSTCERCT
jgi:hypothetical protein